MKLLRKKIIIRHETDYIKVDSMQRFKGQVCVVTGGSGSIGFSISKRFAAEGATVILTGRNEEKLKNACNMLKPISESVDYRIMDVTLADEVAAAIKSVAEKYGRIDILVNNAGYSARGNHLPLHEQSIETIDNILQTNLRGVLLTSAAVVQYMKTSANGRIINIASVVGVQGKENHAEYSAAKAGVIGMTKSHAIELGRYGITVNCVSPGLVPREDASKEKLVKFTETNRLGMICSPDDIASAVAFFASSESRFITGQNLCVDGGRSLGLYGD